ncbi:hypothetical protein PybrP1_001551, partial [[Pythium] brassicae (nom. inval.)]
GQERHPNQLPTQIVARATKRGRETHASISKRPIDTRSSATKPSRPASDSEQQLSTMMGLPRLLVLPPQLSSSAIAQPSVSTVNFKGAGPSPLRRLPLQGYERVMSMADNASVKVAHVMLLRGPASAIDAFLIHAPLAVALTFNKHPRMRAKQVRGEFATAEVHPATVSAAQVMRNKLFEVRDVGRERRFGSSCGGESGCKSGCDGFPETGACNGRNGCESRDSGDMESEWKEFVECECEVPFNRYVSFPFYVRAWRYSSDPSAFGVRHDAKDGRDCGTRHDASWDDINGTSNGTSSCGAIRVMLFSDHYMSDGVSGLVVLNDVLEFASLLSRDQRSITSREKRSEGELSADPAQARPDHDCAHTNINTRSSDSSDSRQPSRKKLGRLGGDKTLARRQCREANNDALSLSLPPSLYHVWFRSRAPWKVASLKWIVNLVGKFAFKHELRSFKPAIPVRADQADFQIPVKPNNSSVLFSQGTRANLQAALMRCKRERVTFFGALAAAVVAAYYICGSEREAQEQTPAQTNVSLTLEFDCNMRKHVDQQLSGDPVGCYMAISPIPRLSRGGVDVQRTRFWDLARQLKRDADEQIDSVEALLPTVFLHKHVNSKTNPEFFADLPIRHSVVSDMDISSVGKYPYALEHTFGVATASGRTLRIESLHLFSTAPHLGPAACLYIASVDSLCYSLMHKHADADARRLLATIEACVEAIGQMGSAESVARVAERAQSTGARVQLRGYERLLSIADNASAKVVHVMVLRGSADARAALLASLSEATVLTFNRHPRMRAKQLRGEFALVEIQPHISLESLSKDELLAIRELDEDGSGASSRADESWEKYVEEQCERPFDRYSQLPYCIHAWHDRRQGLVRLMLFSDHYMSDGISGLAVLNDLVSFSSALSRGRTRDLLKDTTMVELPLRASLYELWLAPHKWRLRLSRWGVALFGKMIFKHELKHFKPVIAPRGDQADLAVPVRVNSTSAFFDKGSPGNMHSALHRCKHEGVTFFGALAASVVLAYYVASGRERVDGEAGRTKPFTLAVDVDFNMRRRVPAPAEEVHVGAFLATSSMESLAKAGVDVAATSFWDFARRCKQEINETLGSVLMPLTLLFLDQFINARTAPEFFHDLPVPHSVSADVNISNIGKYLHATTHLIGAADSSESLHIESVHVYNSSPSVGSAAIVYVTATDQFNFSMSHKYEHEAARTLFRACVSCIERLGEIESHDTLAQVAKLVAAGLNGKDA